MINPRDIQVLPRLTLSPERGTSAGTEGSDERPRRTIEEAIYEHPGVAGEDRVAADVRWRQTLLLGAHHAEAGQIVGIAQPEQLADRVAKMVAQLNRQLYANTTPENTPPSSSPSTMRRSTRSPTPTRGTCRPSGITRPTAPGVGLRKALSLNQKRSQACRLG